MSTAGRLVHVADDVVRVQLYRADAPGKKVMTEDGVEVDGKLLLPTRTKALLKRLFVVAHCYPLGYHGMIELFDDRFALVNTRQAVTRFINQRLLCKHVKGGLVFQRYSAENRPSYGDTVYLLVLKDEVTQCCELVPADTTDNHTIVAAILDWIKRFRSPPTRMSDNGVQFKIEVMELLAEQLGASHGSHINVERVSRDILQALQVMLLESRLDTRNWVYLLPIILVNLNRTSVFSLGNCAPVELFTGSPATSALGIVAAPTECVLRNLPMERLIYGGRLVSFASACMLCTTWP
ncbi:LOW QUALITY PROTEIN: Hypothetical protein PHPALM_514 [Phytophthora palmivora]|uniref:Integrase catalytic domain-containing protein n=1 Tax=Phytophthora palmivora TaxID=4796 RepID=A0A2P4YUL9_9STRA|nr:LOW QUALITY PROTEIN: Hypothetical protein PHPALM_514 [Phytophthora palmivora]